MADIHIPELQASFFGFTIGDLKLATFTAVSGLSVEFDVVEFNSMSKTGQKILRKIPGKAKYSAIELKRGYSPDKELYDWFTKVLAAGDLVKRESASIKLFDRKMVPMGEFTLTECWPSKLSVADMSAGSTEVLIESVTIEHEFLDWKKA